MTSKSRYQYKLLTKFYKTRDEDYIIETFMRENHLKQMSKELFFERFIQKHGMLKCQICGKENLIRFDKNKVDISATIEHIIPKKEGGLRYSSSNFICSCNNCNNNRGDKPLIKISNERYIY